MKNFNTLQTIGRAFMLPIALLPAAGILLGVGAAFTNPTMVSVYHLEWILGAGTILNSFLTVLKDAGDIVFGSLPLLFAVGIAVGMAQNEKGTAALAAAIGFLVMHKSISSVLSIQGINAANTTLDYLVKSGMDPIKAASESQKYAQVFGIFSLQMSVFGGIIVGFLAVSLHNRFYKIQLPEFLGFFGGIRFVPIITAFSSVFLGIISVFLWPYVQNFIAMLASLISKMGYAGTFIYGVIERSLIPFGLHHIFYVPFWQTQLGGTMDISGKLVMGAQNIFFAQLADPGVTHFNVEATKFMAGKFPFMIFGLPAAAFAMYRCAKPEKRKAVVGLLFSAAFTSFLTGITEPIEFTFLFLAPFLYYGVHVLFCGLSFMLMHMLNVGVGQTFSGGFIDLFLFGILQGNAKTNWLMIVLVGVCYALVYYFVFRFFILKFNLKTPGRTEEGEEDKLYSRADVDAQKAQQPLRDLAVKIIEALGGVSNIVNLDACITRLRVGVKDLSKVFPESHWREKLECKGLVIQGDGIQAIYGARADLLKSEINEIM